MADFPIPKNGAQYIFYTGLIDQSNTKLLKASPTLATGDFKVSTDGGAFANLGTLPTVTPAAGTAVKITLSTSEMTGDNIVVTCIDAAGAEWCDQLINIQTTARGVADLAYPATTGRSMVVDAAGLVDANAVKLGPTGTGTAQTARDIGASVLLSAGTGTGQLDFTSGVVKANVVQWIAATVNALIAGRVDANVQAMATAVIAAATYAANAHDTASFTAALENAFADAFLARQMTEGYVANGTAPTTAQALFQIMQTIAEFAISGTTLTVKKIDRTTTAETYTLDDATNPTSRTRAT